MGITMFDVPRPLPNELLREGAVHASGVLRSTGDRGLQSLAEQARQELRTAMAAVSILYQYWQYVVAAAGIPTGVYSRRTSMCGHAILEPDSVFRVLDAEADPRFMANPVVADAGVRFYAGVPLLTAGGLPLGVLCVFDPQPRSALPGADEIRLRKLATRAEQAIRDLSPTAISTAA